MEARSGANLRLARAPSGERHLTDLRHLVELLLAREAEGLRSPEKLLQWFEGERASEGRSPADERLYRLEADSDAVQVVSMHRAKGLEFDFVFCPYLWSVRPGRPCRHPAAGAPRRRVGPRRRRAAGQPGGTPRLHRRAPDGGCAPGLRGAHPRPATRDVPRRAAGLHEEAYPPPDLARLAAPGRGGGREPGRVVRSPPPSGRRTRGDASTGTPSAA